MFRNATDEALSSINVLICCNCAGKCCDSVHRSVRLSKFSNAVTQCLVNATLVCTSHSGNEHKLTWSDELSELKSAFLNSHCVWVNGGGPHYGQININSTSKVICKQVVHGACITYEQRANKKFLKLSHEYNTKNLGLLKRSLIVM